MLLRSPDDPKGLEIDVEIRPDMAEADIWPTSPPLASLERLQNTPWTRNHSYGYLKTPPGSLLKIEGLEFDEISGCVRSLVLAGGRVPKEQASKFSAYCKCGAGMSGDVKAKDKAAAHKCIRVFRSLHDKPGCGPTDARTAGRARRRAEKEATG